MSSPRAATSVATKTCGEKQDETCGKELVTFSLSVSQESKKEKMKKKKKKSSEPLTPVRCWSQNKASQSAAAFKSPDLRPPKALSRALWSLSPWMEEQGTPAL